MTYMNRRLVLDLFLLLVTKNSDSLILIRFISSLTFLSLFSNFCLPLITEHPVMVY